MAGNTLSWCAKFLKLKDIIMYSIKNIILAMLLGIFSSNAYCGWSKVFEAYNGDSFYADFDAKYYNPQKQTYKIWTVFNIKSKNGDTFSLLELVDLDCRNKSVRELVSLGCPKLFGQGELKRSLLNDEKWQDFKTDPLSNFALICNRLK